MLQKLQGPAAPDGAAPEWLQYHLYSQRQQKEEAWAENLSPRSRCPGSGSAEQGAGRTVAKGKGGDSDQEFLYPQSAHIAQFLLQTETQTATSAQIQTT